MAVKKFLDADGVTYLARLLDNYPDNELLGTVITAIQEALDEKQDKNASPSGEPVDLSNYLLKTDIAAWAKAANKPSYTATEVGALPANTTYVTSVNNQTGAVTITVPTNVSSFTNDAGYLTLATLPKYDGTVV